METIQLEQVQLLIVWYVVFIVSTVCHEGAHAYAAYVMGDRTAFGDGLMTLNPVPHIKRTPIGMVVVPLLTFVSGGWMIGWASVPYDPYWARSYPKKAAIMGLCGPGANLVLVVIAGILIHVGISAGIFFAPKSIGFINVVEANSDGIAKGLAVLVSIMFTLNVLLFVFNLIPITPLDGTAWMEFVLRGDLLQQYRNLMMHPTVRVLGIFAAWYILDFIYGPFKTLSLNALYIWRGLSYG